jgi:hypothetical protein
VRKRPFHRSVGPSSPGAGKAPIDDWSPEGKCHQGPCGKNTWAKLSDGSAVGSIDSTNCL